MATKKITPMEAADSTLSRPHCPKCGGRASYIDEPDYTRQGYYRRVWYYCPHCKHRGDSTSYLDSAGPGECMNSLKIAKRLFEVG